MQLKELYRIVCKYFGMDIKEKGRSNNTPLYRKYYCLLAIIYCDNKTYGQIGKQIQRDHSSVTACVKTIKELLEVDKQIIEEFERLEEHLLNKRPELRLIEQMYTPKRDYKIFEYVLRENQLLKRLDAKNVMIKELRAYKEKYKTLKSA